MYWRSGVYDTFQLAFCQHLITTVELGILKGLLKKTTTRNRALTPASLTVHRYIILSETANLVMHSLFAVFFHLKNGIIKLVWESWVQNLSRKLY